MALSNSLDVTAGNANAAPMTRRRAGPEVVAPSNRVNVALPFGKITVQEPSRDLRELTAIVVELAAIVEGVAPGPAINRLHLQARALAAALR